MFKQFIRWILALVALTLIALTLLFSPILTSHAASPHTSATHTIQVISHSHYNYSPIPNRYRYP